MEIHSGKSETIGTENRPGVARVRVRGQGFDYKSKTQEKLRSDESVLCLDCGRGYTTVCLLKHAELYTKKGKFYSV